MFKLALIIPTLNAGFRFEEVLSSIAKQSVQNFKKIAIDSSSNDETVSLAKKYGFVVHEIAKEDFGHGKTRQLGVVLAGEVDLVFFMTQDAVLINDDALEKMIHCFQDKEIAVVYGRQLPKKDAKPIEAHARMFNYGMLSKTKDITDVEQMGIKTAFISNSFSAYRKKTLQAVGGFPNDVILGEDTYLAAKILVAGFKVHYESEALVCHSHNYSLYQEFKRYFDTGVFHNQEKWLQDYFGRAEGEGMRFVFSEMKYLWQNKKIHFLPNAFLRNILKYLAYKLGYNHSLIPLFLKKYFTMNKNFWLFQNKEIKKSTVDAFLENENNKKVAIVHDWFIAFAGAEKVVAEILNIFPQADLFAVVDFLQLKDRRFLKGKSIKTTFIQKLPFAKKLYRYYLFLMPLAIEQLDLKKYDLVISSSHAVAKGVLTHAGQTHVSYVHTPIRYAWDLQGQYLQDANMEKGIKGFMVRILMHYIRLWDLRTANGVDVFLANSHFVAQRIWKTYRRKAKVLYPPVDVYSFQPEETKENYYITVSRLVPYKKIGLIVEAFSKMPERKLVVIGDGPEMGKIQKLASGKNNIELLGFKSNTEMLLYLQKAKAFVFAAEEDFGIAPVEAQACGTPVIAFGKGGALETVRVLGKDSKPTGVLFQEQNISSLCKAVDFFEKNIEQIKAKDCRENALNFSNEKFLTEFQKIFREILT